MTRLLSIPEYVEDVKRVASLSLPWEKLRGKTLLMTGGTGLIGSFLIDVLHAADLGCHIILLGRSEEKTRDRYCVAYPEVGLSFAEIGSVESLVSAIRQALIDFDRMVCAGMKTSLC